MNQTWAGADGNFQRWPVRHALGVIARHVAVASLVTAFAGSNETSPESREASASAFPARSEITARPPLFRGLYRERASGEHRQKCEQLFAKRKITLRKMGPPNRRCALGWHRKRSRCLSSTRMLQLFSQSRIRCST